MQAGPANTIAYDNIYRGDIPFVEHKLGQGQGYTRTVKAYYPEGTKLVDNYAKLATQQPQSPTKDSLGATFIDSKYQDGHGPMVQNEDGSTTYLVKLNGGQHVQQYQNGTRVLTELATGPRPEEGYTRETTYVADHSVVQVKSGNGYYAKKIDEFYPNAGR